MTTITKEQVHAVSDLKAGYTLGHADVAILQRLARIALASLEAEPVGFRSKLQPPSAIGSEQWDYTDHRQPDAFELENCSIECLYTAPPAPVSVPTFEEWCKRTEQKPVGWVRDAMKEAYDACRAAMLQGAYGNSPVIPEGWVACSERMPEGMQTVITSNGFDIGQGWWDGEGWNSFDSHDVVPGDVTHWMLLPSAPQQE